MKLSEYQGLESPRRKLTGDELWGKEVAPPGRLDPLEVNGALFEREIYFCKETHRYETRIIGRRDDETWTGR